MNALLLNRVVNRVLEISDEVKSKVINSSLFKMWQTCLTSLAIVLTLLLLVITNIMI